jgi:PAS domain S-box-containing protein
MMFKNCRGGAILRIFTQASRLPELLARLLLSATILGVLAGWFLLMPWPGQAAEGAGAILLAHQESPQVHRHGDGAGVAAPAKTSPARHQGSGETSLVAPGDKEPPPSSRSQGSSLSGLLPHGTCLSWRPGLLWTHVLSDGLTALAYFSIPVALLVFVRRRRDLQFGWMFVLFGLFILACGAGHLTTIYNLWVPDYLTSGVVKAFTAFVSVITAVIIWPLIPKAVALPGPAQWEEVNRDLRNEIAEHLKDEEEVRRLNAELEQRVLERTAELEAANRNLAEVNRDLREREAQVLESQCLLRAIIDNSTAVIYVKDLEGRYLLINRRFEELFHVGRKEAAGKTDFELFPRERAEAFCAFDRQVLAAGTVLDAEETVPQDDGVHTYLSIKAPLVDAAGNPYAVCGISADITGRKRDEEEIRRLNAELEQKMAELVAAQEELVRKEKLAILGQLSGSVGHELRNPLGVMGNAVYFLKTVHSEGDETTMEYLGIIEQEIDTSQRIITDLLDFARTRPPRTKRIAVSVLIAQSLGRCAVPDNVEHRVEIADSLPALRVDPLQTGQVFQNLISNGVQAMPRGGSLRIGAKHVRCAMSDVRCFEGNNVERRTSNVAPDTDFVEISVADSGEGITPENLKKLFQPLFTTKPKGIGLGLVVCRNLAEANGGWIAVESELGKGTTFTVALPAEKPGRIGPDEDGGDP